MAEDLTDNVVAGVDQNGNTATFRTTFLTGPAAHVQHVFAADPATGEAIKPASQTDVGALGTALASILTELGSKLEPADLAALATAARQDAAKGVLDAILAALAPVATAAAQGTGNASLAAIEGKLPAQVGGKVPVTDPTALPLPAGAATAAGVAEVRDRLPATAHTQPLTDAQLRAAPVAMEAAALPLPAGAGTEASLDAIANLLALIADLLPRLTSNRQAAVAIESGSVGLAASQTLATLSDMQRVGGQYVNGNALQGAGLAVIYNNVEVT